MVLPVVLVLMLGVALLSSTVLALAGGERVLDREGFRYLRSSVREEAVLGSPSPRTVAGSSDVDLEVYPLSDGFTLLSATDGDRGTSSFAVAWNLRPDLVAAGMPGGLEVATDAPDRGVVWQPACPFAGTRPLVRARGSGAGGLAVPPPRVGPLTVAELRSVARTPLEPGEPFPVADGPQSYRIPPAARVRGGAAEGFLVSEGPLALTNGARFRGLVVVAGTLTVEEGARIEGVVLAGSVQLPGSGPAITGCPESVLPALELPELSGLHPVPGGGYLGRF